MSAFPNRRPWWANEDWLAVVTGGALLAVVALLWRPALPLLKWGGAAGAEKLLAEANLLKLATLGALLLGCTAIALTGTGLTYRRLLPGFAAVFGLAMAAQVFAGHAAIEALGLEHVIFSLLLGLLVSNTVGVPKWLSPAVRTEFYIKTGLVILGSSLLFQEILQAGALGLVQAVLVVAAVWAFAFWLARRLRVDDEFAAMLSTAVSICGVSAAIAACGAIQGDRRKLSYITTLVLLCAVPMMVLMPWAAKHWGMDELVAGAWLGGTLDTSGSVVAAGALISEPAMKVGVIVKFSQNVLLGVAAFFLSVWWSLRGQADGANPRVGVSIIWERFPKFLLGFIAASLVFSFLLEPARVKEAKGALSGLRNAWFALAFVSIGLESRFRDLVGLGGGRPAVAFLGGQAFNVVWTLLLAWLLFGGVWFAAPVLR
ncbi:MAG: putative sulfate exporter family transporter [Verrucomicrobia bacterium]|nr:putative sulfate exporter family transporter [Verrucomicrobiota bacterium]